MADPSLSRRALARRCALARDLRLSAHRRATRPDAASIARLIRPNAALPRREAPPSGYSGDSSRRDQGLNDDYPDVTVAARLRGICACRRTGERLGRLRPRSLA